ncbi:hypothetical protein [Xanthomonas cannabis]|uniref:hypothetical protein n=1 Tax=Xanthomonas cannabis TaxID=1885674 RepID=UPI0011119E54|nr:hypothetical protein [Xanthomonas cannabis]
MKLVRKNVLLGQSQIDALIEMAIRKRTSVNELVRLGVEGVLSNQRYQTSGDVLLKEFKSLMVQQEQRLDQVCKELLSDLKLGIDAFNHSSEKHIDRSSQLTKQFVLNLSDALNGEVTAEQAVVEKKPVRSSRDILMNMENQKSSKPKTNFT